ncbi:LOW QUALITY PROTEIN: hypothetical protein U9M48_035403, partial [Paspalum notatum var. saurae]
NIKEAIFSLKHNKAPGPDGIPAEFYQQFYETIKGDLLQMFWDLSKGDLPLFSLNFRVITLIPNVQEAKVIQQYRPICLLNVSYKIFTKVATNWLTLVADKVVSPTQTAFIKSQNILEGVVVLFETIHELIEKTKRGNLLDFDKKAYDKVQWPFLFKHSKWISWIETFISSGTVAVNINDDVRHYFQTKKEDSTRISITSLVQYYADQNWRGSLRQSSPHLVDGGLSILQNADDIILFMYHDPNKAHNMKLLLFAFEQALGLKINFHKSELFCFGDAQDKVELYIELFGCKARNFPINYLGIPIHFRKLRNCDWVQVEERFEKRLNSWKGKHLPIGGRLTLINSVLSSLPMYMMSFFSIPKGVLKKLDYFRLRFFWQGDENKKKYKLAKLSILCQPKDQGGLGILDLSTKNSALLCKWMYKLLTSDGMWQQIHRNKYIGSKPLDQVEWKIGDSHFWSCPMKVKLDFLCFGTFLVKEGSQVRFWEDIWLDGAQLKEQYPSLYNIARPKSITIVEAMSSSPPSIYSRRQLYGTNLDNWYFLLSCLEGLELS